MLLINSIQDSGLQNFLIPYLDDTIILDLRFSSTVESWFADIEYKGVSYKGECLTLGVLSFESTPFPFRVMIEEKNQTGIDPFRLDDFITERCLFYIVSLDEAEVIRGR